MSDDLFRCKSCGEIDDKDNKNAMTFSKWSTKASARVALCGKCFTTAVVATGLKLEWKDWPERE